MTTPQKVTLRLLRCRLCRLSADVAIALTERGKKTRLSYCRRCMRKMVGR